MKKLIAAAMALISFSVINKVQAQKGLSISVKATPQLSWMLNENDKDNNALESKPLYGVSFGVGAGYNFTNHFGVQVDALYSMQGRKYETLGNEFNQRVHYIKIAPMFTYTTPSFGIVSFVGKVGPQVSFLADSKLTNNDGDKIIKDMDDRYERVTIGGVTGISAQFKVSKNIHLTVGPRIDLDFSNAEDENAIGYLTGRKTTYNSNLGVEAGLRIQL